MSSANPNSLTIPPELESEMTPAVRAFVQTLACPACGEMTCAELPCGVPQGQSGPRLMAFTALLMASYRQSKRRPAEFLSTLLGQPCCPALTVKIENQVMAAVRPSSEALGPVRRNVERLLLRGTECGRTDTRGTCRELYEHRPWRWTFLRHEGIEPTNNAGERSLRHAVIWRKLSFGTQSASGSRFVETLLTVVETCRQQHRNAFAFLTQAVAAHLAHQAAPSLLPGA
jgi:hypothetical protein